jgi:hypothetical protein
MKFKSYIQNLASQLDIPLTSVDLKSKLAVGSIDASILSLGTDFRLVAEVIFQSELDALNSGTESKLLELKIKTALLKLKR